MPRQRYLLDINMLLDTRYGAMRRIDAISADEVVKSPEYQTRYHDDFSKLSHGKISDTAFKEIYTSYDLETFALSLLTNFIFHLREDLKSTGLLIDRGIFEQGVEIVLNTYPYHNLDAEFIKILLRAIRHYIPTIKCDVTFDHVEYGSLSPQLFARDYEVMMIYDRESWLLPNKEKLLGCKIPDKIILTPRISPNGEILESLNNTGDPFNCYTLILKEWITLAFIPSSWVSFNYHAYHQAKSQMG